MEYFLFTFVGIMFWVIFNLVFLLFYNKLIYPNPNLSDKFKRKFILIGLIIPGINIFIIFLIFVIAILTIIAEAIKEEFSKRNN